MILSSIRRNSSTVDVLSFVYVYLLYYVDPSNYEHKSSHNRAKVARINNIYTVSNDSQSVLYETF